MDSISKLIVCDKHPSITKYQHALAVRPSGYYGVKLVKTQNLRGQGVNDGKIKGLSSNTLCRLREALARTSHTKDEYSIYGVCLTLPWGKKNEDGTPSAGCPTQEQGAQVWAEFTKNLSRLLDALGMGAIFRVELQEREAPHWHLQVYLPDDLPEDKARSVLDRRCPKRTPRDLMTVPTYIRPARNGKPRRRIVSVGNDGKRSHFYALCALRIVWALTCNRMWHKFAMKAMPDSLLPAPVAGGTGIRHLPPMPDDIETFEFCVDAFPLEGIKAGMAYLASHTSKHKQAQLGYVGKQWGFLGKKHLKFSRGVSVKRFDSLEDRGRVYFFRYIRKWCEVNRPLSAWLKVRPSRILTKDGVEIFTGLTVRNYHRIYLFGIPDAVIDKALKVAFDNEIVF